jgi:hypothetical protein
VRLQTKSERTAKKEMIAPQVVVKYEEGRMCKKTRRRP